MCSKRYIPLSHLLLFFVVVVVVLESWHESINIRININMGLRFSVTKEVWLVGVQLLQVIVNDEYKLKMKSLT